MYIQRPPPEADIMDDGARKSWFQSFLPSNLTDSGKPRMVTTFDTVFHGFVAWLTEAELEVMSKKPGVSRCTEVEMLELNQVGMRNILQGRAMGGD